MRSSSSRHIIAGSVLLELAVFAPIALLIPFAVISIWGINIETEKLLASSKLGARAGAGMSQELALAGDRESACCDNDNNSAVLNNAVEMAFFGLQAAGLESGESCNANAERPSPRKCIGSTTYDISADFDNSCESLFCRRSIEVLISSKEAKNYSPIEMLTFSFSLSSRSVFPVLADCSSVICN